MAIGFSSEAPAPFDSSTRCARILQHRHKAGITTRDELRSMIKRSATHSQRGNAASHAPALVDDQRFSSRCLLSSCSGKPGYASANHKHVCIPASRAIHIARA